MIRFLIAAAMLVTGASVARADPVSIAIITAVGLTATPGLVAVTTFGIQLALGVGVTCGQAPRPRP